MRSLAIVDLHGRSTPVQPGRIQDCQTTKQVGIKDCAVILCKEAKEQPTGLSCEYYVPKIAADVVKVKTEALHSYRDQGISKTIDQIVDSAQKSNSMDAIATKCLDPLITCYLNSRYYPGSKSPSTAKLSQLLHKKTYILKNSDQLEISVFKD